MPGFSDRLAAMKAKQEAGEQQKSTERAKTEREARRGELSKEREAVYAELVSAAQAAHEAGDAVTQAESFAAEQGENLDPEAKAEIDAIKSEASELVRRLESLKIEAARVDKELEGLSSEGSASEKADVVAETHAETSGTGMESIAKAQTEVLTESTENNERMFDALSSEDATKRMQDELNNVAQDENTWYSKILESTGTVSDVSFALEQAKKVRQAGERLLKIGSAYIEKRTKEGKKSVKFNEILKLKLDAVNALATKIEDRAMLSTEGVSEDEIDERMHPVTIQEDLDILRDRINETFVKARDEARKPMSLATSAEKEHCEKMKVVLDQAVDSYTQEIKMLADLTRIRRKEFEKLFTGAKDTHDEIVGVVQALTRKIEQFRRAEDLIKNKKG